MRLRYIAAWPFMVGGAFLIIVGCKIAGGGLKPEAARNITRKGQ